MTKMVWRSTFVLLTVASGAGSMLLLGMFLLFGPISPLDLGFDRWAALAWDGGLTLAFCLQHSIMVRRSFRRWMERLVDPLYHGAIYAIASAVVLIAMVLLWQETSILLLKLEGGWRWLTRAVFLITLAGFYWSARALGSFDALGIDPIRGREPRHTPLSIRGPYRWVRHPLYLFVLILIWACPDLTDDRLLFNLLWSIWIVVASVLEELDLVVAFGDDYREYQRRVPMLLPWKPPLLAKPR
jgi:protein-S-isoprenylcysteine O-methyltransferase Ste14